MQIDLNQDDIYFIGRSLNFFWHDAYDKLQPCVTLGDIEREHYIFQLNRSKELMDKLNLT